MNSFSYSTRTGNVSITLDGVANDGETGENDNFGTDIEIITGGLGNDTINGNSSANTITGGAGNDCLVGNGGDDYLEGDAVEILLGVAGIDTLDGGDDNDSLDGGAGTDSIVGGNGTNTASYATRSEALILTLDDTANDGTAGENDNLEDIENLTGGSGQDSIVGDENDNALNGGAGNDTIVPGDSGHDHRRREHRQGRFLTEPMT